MKEEKIGSTNDFNAMRKFAEFINCNNLVDLPMCGSSFTWFRSGTNISASKLDRFLVSPEICSWFPDVSQYTLNRALSDHCPVLLKEGQRVATHRPFKWFNHWAEDPDFDKMIKEKCSSIKRKGIGEKLRLVKAAVKSWVAMARSKDVDTTDVLENKIATLERKIVAKGALPSEVSLRNTEIQSLKAQLWGKYRREEREWLQKSRLKLFKEGDRNTNFFHLTASVRSKVNHIQCLRVNGNLLKDQHGIATAFEDHFKGSYNRSSTLPVKDFVVNFRRLKQSNVLRLEAPFSEEEVWSALRTSDEDVNDFRPISLVSSVYKIVAKVLSRRLAGCMEEVIGDNQFAFLQGKQITDCVLTANETIEDIRRRKRAALVFKADFQKAYDTIDWDFLDFILEKMGFRCKWRSWISYCISSATISVLVNGSPTNRFSIKRGLRQGCPLSPFLFNCMGEALSLLLEKARSFRVFKGVEVGNSGFVVSHIQFADDLIVFTEASVANSRNIKRILRVFEVVSGLRLNPRKSKLYGLNVENCLVEDWAQQIQCIVDKFPTTYLGLPLGFSRNSIELWNPVIEKFRKRLDGWKGKLLSFGGRITLLRSVFSNLHVYFMSLFQVPTGVAESLNKIMANFLWGPEASRPIHWVKWENVCRAKVNGGLGWFEISTRNRSLLNNRVWRYGSEAGSLWRRVVDSKYDLDSMSLLPQPPEGRKTSWIWKNISKPLAEPSNNFVNAIRFKLGDGRRINFWEDFWTEVPSLKLSFPRVFGLVLKKSGKVCEFGSKVEGKWIWSFKVRRALFSWEQAVWDEFIRIINEGAADLGTMDVLKWEHASNGVYSAKKFCELESALGSTEDKIWKLVWSGLAPPKVEGFLWKVILGRIPTLVELDKRGALHSSSTRCALCSRDEETVNHIFCLCEIGWKVWSKWVNEWRIRPLNDLLKEDANVYKLIGPVLVKQDLAEANVNVRKRIEYISAEL
ncbi:hypothetical protein GQ457_09G021820 [Hibiscus cannabinus]